MFYVYEHIRKDTLTPFYIGKGKDRRAKSLAGRSSYWRNVVNKAGGYEIKYLAEDIDEEFAFLLEIEAIDAYRKRGMKLVNLTNGGDGSSGYKYSPETIQKIAEKNRGLKRSDDSKEKMSAAKRGRKLPEETKEKMSAAKKGKPPNNTGKVYKMKQPFTAEHRLKMSLGRRGRKMSPESSLKKSLATKGVPKSEETRMRMKLAQSSPEARAKQSERMKAIRAMQKLKKQSAELTHNRCLGRLNLTGSHHPTLVAL